MERAESSQSSDARATSGLPAVQELAEQATVNNVKELAEQAYAWGVKLANDAITEERPSVVSYDGDGVWGYLSRVYCWGYFGHREKLRKAALVEAPLTADEARTASIANLILRVDGKIRQAVNEGEMAFKQNVSPADQAILAPVVATFEERGYRVRYLNAFGPIFVLEISWGFPVPAASASTKEVLPPCPPPSAQGARVADERMSFEDA